MPQNDTFSLSLMCNSFSGHGAKKSVINVSIIWLNDDIYSRNTWFPTTDVQTQNIGKLRYANRRAPTECRHTVATQATEYQRWRDVGCRSRRCRPMPTLGKRRNASWAVKFELIENCHFGSPRCLQCFIKKLTILGCVIWHTNSWSNILIWGAVP